MEIENLKINAYGKIENKEIDLKRGINIIHGSNESGKTTILNYIISSFYGISKIKDGKPLSDYERYKPWNNKEFSGKIKYKLDNNKEFEVFRDFEEKSPKIYNENLEDITDSFEIDKKEGNRFFIEQTGIDKQMYLSTVVSMQEEVRLDDKKQNSLIQKIANLAGTGEDNVSYKKVLTKLQDKIRNEIGSKKTSQKPINIIEKEINEIKIKLEELEKYRDRKYEIDNEKENVRKQIESLELEKKILQELQDGINNEDTYRKELEINQEGKNKNLLEVRVLKSKKTQFDMEENNIKDEIEDIKNNIDKSEKRQEEIAKNIEIIKEISNENNNKKESKNNLVLNIILILTIIVFIMSVVIKNYILLGSSIIAIISIVIINIVKLNNNKKIKKEKKHEEIKNKERINKLEEEKSLIQERLINYRENLSIKDENLKEISTKNAMIKGQIELLEKNINEIEQKQERIKSEKTNISNNLKEEIREKYKEVFNDINNLLEDSEYSLKLENVLRKINDKKIEEKGLEIEYDSIVPKLDEIINLQERLELDIENEKELKKKEDTINIAINNLMEAYEEMKNTITPKFAKNLSLSISKISERKYEKVNINDEKGIIVENKRGEYIEVNKLSTGTIDQLYLSLRLSMINDLSTEKLPIILDEIFAYFDNERLKNAIIYLKNELSENQIIIFTCTNREKEILDAEDIKYNLIEL